MFTKLVIERRKADLSSICGLFYFCPTPPVDSSRDPLAPSTRDLPSDSFTFNQFEDYLKVSGSLSSSKRTSNDSMSDFDLVMESEEAIGGRILGWFGWNWSLDPRW